MILGCTAVARDNDCRVSDSTNNKPDTIDYAQRSAVRRRDESREEEYGHAGQHKGALSTPLDESRLRLENESRDVQQL